jgi:hypothetical protein
VHISKHLKFVQGFAVGGLSELSRQDFQSARFAVLLAEELGAFGLRPHVLSTLLAGKSIDIVLSEEPFWRKIAGSQRPADLETAMQLLHRLFMHTVGLHNITLALHVAHFSAGGDVCALMDWIARKPRMFQSWAMSMDGM